MQLRYHSPLGPGVNEPIYHPIFYRVKERPPGSPISPMSEFPPDIEWETRFVKCSYAMVRQRSCIIWDVVLMTVCGPLFVLGTILFPTHQTPYHPLLDHPYSGPLSGLSGLGLPDAYLPSYTSSMG